MLGVTNNKHYQDIANAIREKNKTTTQYKPSEMAEAIRGLGGLAEAVLIVNAPVGSTVTATKDSDVVSEVVTEGKVLLLLPSSGTWNVKAELGERVAEDSATLTKYSAKEITLVFFSATLTVTAVPLASILVEGIKRYTATADDTGKATIEITKAEQLAVSATFNNVTSSTSVVSVSEIGQTYETTVTFIIATITAPENSTVSVTKDSYSYTFTATTSPYVLYLPEIGTWKATASLGSESTESNIEVTEYKNYDVELSFVKIYGVSWNQTSTTAFTRTDDSAGFADPVPYVSGESNYGSPFDNLYPWSGMNIVEDSKAGTLVSIPKFWYKITKNDAEFKIQIADKQVSGFMVSPAHRDRGDGKGERDIVYIGRYKCDTSYQSNRGQYPVVNVTRENARIYISRQDATIWQTDILMMQTIQLLYLVEFADWNSQTKIGYGCGNNTSRQNTGASDIMPYHTGTMQTSRRTYGVGTQYRHIEDLWGNVYDWMDGCYYNSLGLNIIKNPSSFSDSSGGTWIGTPSSGYPTVMSVSTTSGFEGLMYPTAANGSNTTYIPDYWDFYASGPCLYSGGSYYQNLSFGLFRVYAVSASDSYASVGCRLQKLP